MGRIATVRHIQARVADVRIVPDAGSTIWGTVFRGKANGDESTMAMDDRSHTLLAKLLASLIRCLARMVLNAVGRRGGVDGHG